VRKSELVPGGYIPRGFRKRRLAFDTPGEKRRRVQVPTFNRASTVRTDDILKIDELRKKIHNGLRGSGHRVLVNRLVYNNGTVQNRNGNPVQVKNVNQVFPVTIRSKNAGHAVGVVKARDTMYVFDPHGKHRSPDTDTMARKLAANLGVKKVLVYSRTVPQEHNKKGVCFGFVSLFLTRVTPQLLKVPNKNTFENIVSNKLNKFNTSKCNRLHTWMHRPLSYTDKMLEY
jgi:hypothetical protein